MTYDEAKILESYWGSVRQELEVRIQNEEIALRTCGAEELKEIQARIKVYEELKTLPTDIVERLSMRA